MAEKFNISFGIILVFIAFLFFGNSTYVSAQTPANTQINNQAKATFKYKSFPNDTVNSNAVRFSVLAAPNFELSFGSIDTTVFAKETLVVSLVYKNIGNTMADSVTIDGVLPPAGLRFLPGSTDGTIHGNTATWSVLNVAPGTSDSVRVKVIVDSTLSAGINLQLNGTISWLSTSTSATQTLVVSNFPRLEITNTPLSTVVGSGRSMTYQLTVKNSGNITSSNTTLVDTISSLGTYKGSDVAPNSISSNKRIITWNIGGLNAFSEKTITVTVGALPNLGSGELMNTAYVSASNISQGALAISTVSVVPITPKSIDITRDPKFIFGMVNKDSSKIDVVLKDSLGQLLPDGASVQFTTSLGTFLTSTKSISTTVENGTASVYLRSEDIQNKVVHFYINVVGGSVESGTITDSTDLYMYPGAVTGKVVNGPDQQPYQGAIAKVFNQTNQVVGSDTTKADGKFFIALNKDVAMYLLEIVVIDKFGDTLSTHAPIDPTQFPQPALKMPNSITGRILYSNSGLPVPAPGVTIYLDSIAGGTGGGASKKNGIMKSFGIVGGAFNRVEGKKTDQYGRFIFENLKPAKYILSVDSIQFPNMKGISVVSDSVSGTFTINLSIQIQQDSTISFIMSSASSVNAGDTLSYHITTNNTGNYLHQTVSIIDTIPAFTKYISSSKGNYETMTYDTSTGIVQWGRDSLAPNVNDSVSLKLLLATNIPDSTKIRNTVWFRSNLHESLNQTTVTTVRSLPNLSFGNFFAGTDSIVAGDSVLNKIWFSNTGTDSLHGIVIIDTIFHGGLTKIKYYGSDSVAVADSVVRIFVGAIPPHASDTMSFTIATDFSLTTGTRILSSARVLQNDSSIANAQAVLMMVDNPDLSSYLKITKTGNKKVAEIGDIVTYQISISNTCPTFVVSLGVYDLLPHAFKYIKKSARFNGKAIEPTFKQNINSLTWNLPDTILSGETATLVYQLALGADALASEGLNTAYASANTSVGTQLVSAASQWQITVRPGVFTEKGLIIGKVFYDDNRNTYQESGENGIKGVELWMEDGTKIVTGDDGKYSLPEVKPGQHVVRVNESTLPPGTELLGGSTDFANDPVSRFVNVTESGIAKANFFVKRNTKDSIAQSVGRIGKLIGVRQVIPKYLYQDTIRNIKIDTVEMIVSFAYSGKSYLQSIDVNEVLGSEFSIVPNSATYNGRKVTPIIYGTSVSWNLGKAQQRMQGTLRYKAAITQFPKTNSTIFSVSTVKVTTADSMVIETNKLATENIVQDVSKNQIGTSEVLSKLAIPELDSQMGDSVVISSGDEVFFKTILVVDPKKKIKSVQLIDSLESSFITNERSFAVNGIPIPHKNLTMRVRSSSFTSRAKYEKNEIEFLRIASVDLVPMVRSGQNEITYSAKLHAADQETTFTKRSFAVIRDEFNEESIISSTEVKLLVKPNIPPLSAKLDTAFFDRRRNSTTIKEKIADAIKLVESLTRTKTKSVVMEGITFENNSTTLTPESREILDNIVNVLTAKNGIKIKINGYTDNTGNASLNLKISLKRAQEVRLYLLGKGISPKRVLYQGFGSENPIATNKTEEGRMKNRRVEFEKIQ